MMKKILIVLLYVLATGCSKNDNSARPSPYIGNWYFGGTDAYLEITKTEVLLRECSLNDGYVSNGEAKLTLIDDIILSSIDGVEEKINLEIREGQLIAHDEEGEYESELSRVDNIPEYCSSDALEITYASPVEVVQGETIEFIVSFDYRLTSQLPAEIRVGRSNGEVGAHLVYDEVIELSSQGLGSGSFTVLVTPEVFDSKILYDIEVSMIPVVDVGAYYTQYATDRVILKVSQIGDSSLNSSSSIAGQARLKDLVLKQRKNLFLR